VDLGWVLKELGAQEVTSLLVEGGGEVNATMLFEGHAHRIAFFYAPKILGGGRSVKGVAGTGAFGIKEALKLKEINWCRLDSDLLLEARIA
jgi:diaminohydroxyphosphoribosylaminopyrimidine deaminase/5-amino-6-(5-phosphoribosylamino)uracil reductase